MSSSTNHLNSAVERDVIVRTRADIQVVVVPSSGNQRFILKDPLTLEFFQLTVREHFLFEQLQNRITLSELKQKFEDRFAPQTISYTALQEGINHLYEQGLVLSTARAQGQELLTRSAKKRQLERWQSLLKFLSFRVASWDAAGITDYLYARLSFLFTRTSAFVAFGVIAYAIWLLVAHLPTAIAKSSSISEFWSPEYLAVCFATIVIIKIIHEFAHALACRHFGGRCHDMGIMLLAFFPTAYCDVSDAWLFPRRSQRIFVAAAGMIAELFLAAVAFIGWCHTQPGLLNIWFLSVAVICSINTLAINANPLLRFDAYYIISDWLDIPNLSSRSRGLLTAVIQRWLLNQRSTDDQLLSKRQRQAIWFYAIASRIYGLIVLIAIYAMMIAFAKRVHLETVVYTFAMLTCVGLFIPFIVNTWQFVRNPANRVRIRMARLALLSAGCAAVAFAILFVPIKHEVKGSAVFIPTRGKTVYAAAGGELIRGLEVGTRVQKGDVIAELHDPQLELTTAKYSGEYAVKQANFQQINTLRAIESRASTQLPTAYSDMVDAKSQLEQYQQRTRELTVHAPIDGTIIGPPLVKPEYAEDRLPPWSGSPLEERNRGCWIEPATVLCIVGDPEQLSALVAIEEQDIAGVQSGKPVRILLDSAPVKVITGKVRQVASRATTSDKKHSQDLNSRFHIVEVELDEKPALALVGSAATAKIEAERNTLAGMTLDFFKRRLKLPW